MTDKYRFEIHGDDRSREAFRSLRGNLQGSGGAVKALGADLGNLRGALNSTAAVVTGFAGVGVLGALVASSIRAEREVGNLARAFGVNAQALKEWQHAGETAGVRADKIGNIMKDVSDKIGDFAVTGGGEGADLFEKLNLDVREFVGLAPDQQLLKIGEALQQVGTRSEKIFFLESIADDASLLLPLLEDNAGKLRELQQEARSFGLSLSETDASQLQRAGDAMFRMEQASRGLANQLTVALAPGIESISAHVVEAAKHGETLAEVMDTAFTSAAVVLSGRFAGAVAAQVSQMSLLSAATYKASVQTNALGQVVGRTTAATRAAAVAASGLKAAYAFLGGPVGVITIALASLVAWNAAQPTTEQKAENLTDRVDELTRSWKNLTEAQRVNRAQQALAEREDLAAQINKLTEERNLLRDGGAKQGSRFGYQVALGADNSRVLDLTDQIDTLQQKLDKADRGIANLGKPSKEQFQSQARAEFEAALAREEAERKFAEDSLRAAQEDGAQQLAQLDAFLADKKGKLDLDHQARLQDIAALQVSEQELARRGFESMEALRAEYSARENARYQLALQEMQANDAGGGTGKGADGLTDQEREQLAAKLETLKLSWLTELEQLQVQQDEEMALLDAGFAEKLLSHEEYERQLTLLEGKHSKERAKLEAASSKSRWQSLASAFDAMLGISDTSSKKLFKIQKGLALAKAVATLPSAVIESYNNSGGYPWGIPAALAMAATGAAQIAQIKSAGFSSGGVGGASVSAGGGSGISSTAGASLAGINQFSNSAAAAPGSQVSITIAGDLIGDNAQTIADKITTLIAEQDLVIIPSGSRQAQELAG